MLGYAQQRKKAQKYLRDNLEGGLVYTVDEVSVELGIPRPTVYRYLKEYSIPFTRRSGRIFVPEASVGKIRTVRELHDSGFGTEAVRARLSKGEGTDLDRVAERLDKLTEAIQNSRPEQNSSVEPAHASPDAHALRMVLARQSLLISAISNMADMVGDLMAANGLPRRAVLEYPDVERSPGRLPFPDPPHKSLVIPQARSASNGTASSALARRPNALPSNIPHEKFGTLARRRRAIIASCLFATVLLTILVWRIL